MKKIMSILTASLFVVALSSCGGDDASGSGSESSSSQSSGSESSSSQSSGFQVESQILIDCKSIGLANFNEDPRPEEFDAMNIPSNEDMAACICEEIIGKNTDMTNEELTAFWSDDIDPQGEEAKNRMNIMVNCMGFDSMEDYMSRMMQMMQQKQN